MLNLLKEKFIICIALVAITIVIIIGIATQKQNKEVLNKNEVQKEFKSLNNKEEEKSKETDKKQFKNEEVNCIEIIDRFNKYINEGNFQEVFNMFNEEYVKDFDINAEKLSIKYGFKDRIFFVESIKQSTYSIIKTKFYKDLTYKEYVPVTFTIFNDGSIADIDITDIKEYKDKINIKGLDICLIKKYNTSTDSIYIIDILNSTSSILNISESDTGFYGIDSEGYEVGHKLLNKAFYEVVPSKIPKRFVVKIKYFNPTSIGIKLKDKDAEEKIKLFDVK